MGQQYPELVTDRKRIETVALAEEAAFLKTLKAGTNILDTAVTETKAAGGTVLAGDKAFLLHDTWGFPIDLTLEMAAEQGLSVDEDGFRRLMKEQRDRAKADARAKKTGHADLSAYREVADAAGATEFTGYTDDRGRVRRSSACSSTASPRPPPPRATRSRSSSTAPRSTPRAAASSPTHGRIKLDTGAVVEVRDVPAAGPRRLRAQGRRPGRRGDRRRRRPTPPSTSPAAAPSPAPTAPRTSPTRRCATPSARRPPRPVRRTRRAASASTSARPPPCPGTVLTDVEQKINEVLARELDVTAEVMSIDEAKKQGAIAEFGEKYGERVRVVTIGDFSKELCGGTHVHNTAQLGLVKLLGESSIGSGVRRVEALVGVDAYNFLAREHTVVAQLTELVKGRPEELPEKISGMLGQAEGRREGDRAVPRGEGAPGRRRPRRRAPRTYAVSRWSPARCRTAPPPTTCASWCSTSAAGIQGGRPGRRGPVHRGQRPPADRHRHQRGRPRARPQGRRPGPYGRQDPRRRRRRQAGRRPGRRPEPGRHRRGPGRRRAPGRRDGVTCGDATQMRRGRRLAIDVGDARIGVASCDPDGVLATPVETVPGRDVPAAQRRLGSSSRSTSRSRSSSGCPAR